MDNVADSPGTDNVSHRQGIGLAAMLCAHLADLLGLLYGVACLDGFREYIGKRLLYIAILSSTHNFRAQLGMLEITGRDHHAVDVFIGKQLFGVFIGLRLRVEYSL